MTNEAALLPEDKIVFYELEKVRFVVKDGTGLDIAYAYEDLYFRNTLCLSSSLTVNRPPAGIAGLIRNAMLPTALHCWNRWLPQPTSTTYSSRIKEHTKFLNQKRKKKLFWNLQNYDIFGFSTIKQPIIHSSQIHAITCFLEKEKRMFIYVCDRHCTNKQFFFTL